MDRRILIRRCAGLPLFLLLLYSFRLYRAHLERTHGHTSQCVHVLLMFAFLAVYRLWGKAVEWYWQRKSDSVRSSR